MSIENELRDGIQKLKLASEKYGKLSADEQKRIRHLLYQQEGTFAKIILKGPIEEMIQHHAKLSGG